MRSINFVLVLSSTLAVAPAAHAASFMSRSGTGALAASCPAAPLGGGCPTVPNTIPVVTVGNYPITQVWNVLQPGLSNTSYVGSAATGYAGAIGNVFTSGLTPVLQVGGFTIPDARGQYAVGFGAASALYAYTYTGPAPTALPLVGDINFVINFAAPTTLALNYSFGQTSMRMAVGTSNLFKGSILTAADTACGAADVLAADSATGSAGGFVNGFATQSFNFTLDLTNGCDGQPMMLNPGQSVYIYTYLDAYAQNGAMTDATRSFHVNLAPGTSPAVAAALQNGLKLHANVPEPSSWAMMIAGFGMMGGAMRRRQLKAIAR